MPFCYLSKGSNGFRADTKQGCIRILLPAGCRQDRPGDTIAGKGVERPSISLVVVSVRMLLPEVVCTIYSLIRIRRRHKRADAEERITS